MIIYHMTNIQINVKLKIMPANKPIHRILLMMQKMTMTIIWKAKKNKMGLWLLLTDTKSKLCTFCHGQKKRFQTNIFFCFFPKKSIYIQHTKSEDKTILTTKNTIHPNDVPMQICCPMKLWLICFFCCYNR